MAEMRGMLLVLLCVSHSSASCGIQKVSLVDESEENLVRSMQFPWVVSVQDSQYTHLAFGSILSKFWIVSIASAFQNRKKAIVMVGIANMDPRYIAHTEYPVSTIIIHEDFDNRSKSNNIALLRTDSAMHFNDLVQSICFLGKKLHKPHAMWNCWVSGWNPTSASGHHMTMSILRRIAVKDTKLCSLPRPRRTGCGNHVQKETTAVCLGEPGSPLMCQLQQLGLWVLKGILTHGGERCPGLFVYTKVEDYSDWITSRARLAGPPLSSLQNWERLIPFTYYIRQPTDTQTAVTQRAYSELYHSTWPQSHFQEQTRPTVYSQPANHSGDGLDFREKGQREAGRSPERAVQPMYYDYYGEAEEGGAFAGQNRSHQPQEMTWVFFVLVFLGSSV